MDQKMKFIVIGLIIFSIICLVLFMQATSQQQSLLRESNDLRAENSTLLNKANQLENDLKENQGRIDSLKAERDKGAQVLRDLQGKLDLVSKSRDELVEKLKKQPQQRQEVISVQQQQFTAPENNDAYWGAVLKEKTDLEIQLSSVQEGLRSLQISNESLQRQKSILELDINRLGNEKKDLLRQLDYNQKLLDSMSQEVVREKNDKVGIQDSLKLMKAENDILSRQLKSLNNRKEILDKKVQGLQEGRSSVDKRLSEMEAMLAEKISQIDSLRNELDALKSSKREFGLEKKSDAVELPAIVVHSSPAKGREKAEISEFVGKILAINTDNNFVVIDLGTSAGVKVGDSFNVYREDKLIGSIAVIQARENISACDIKRISTTFKIGDNIK